MCVTKMTSSAAPVTNATVAYSSFASLRLRRTALYGPEITPERHSIGASYMWSCRWNPHKRNIFWVSVQLQVKIVSKADDFQNQAQPLEDLARRLKSHFEPCVVILDFIESRRCKQNGCSDPSANASQDYHGSYSVGVNRQTNRGIEA
ncbi:Uncharacterized protein Rs2_02705 [Raphanus sativus]|nr:Uncharacterized protein Rs2_02705 [Raphanus sativus]